MLALPEAWPATTTAAIEMTVKVKTPNSIPINLNARLSAIASPSLVRGKNATAVEWFRCVSTILHIFPDLFACAVENGGGP
jgi:hypothetical protein